MTAIYILIALAFGVVLGGIIGYQYRKVQALKQRDNVEQKVEVLLSEAKAKEKEILLAANDKALKLLEDAKQEVKQQREATMHAQQRLEKRESLFDQKLLDLEGKKQELVDKAAQIDKIKEEINNIKDQQIEKLQSVASMSKEQAVDQLLVKVEAEEQETLLNRMKKLSNQTNDEVEKKAKSMISLAMQRCASSHATDTTTTSIDIPSDEMKGRIIGREGRNIRTIEKLTGTEIIIDDTPESITVSGFSPIRRHIAKRAIEKLVSDGRIHPGRIEEAIEESKRELALEIKKAGEDAMHETGIIGLDPKLVQIVGRLKYRTSYGQNILHHSIEVSHLSGLLAEQLGADVAIAKKGGLLHDIGKAVDHEVTGNHTTIGYDILKKFGLPEEVAWICIAHHEDDPKTLEGAIVKVADAISGARPGARKDTYEQYVQRLTELEGVANAFDGVDKSYAIQAGREIRVFVRPEKVDDLSAAKLARDVAKKIEAELRYPGEIKVTIIRETRITEYAR